MKLFRNLYLTKRFFFSGAGVVLFFIFSFSFPLMVIPSRIILGIWFILSIYNIYQLNRKSTVVRCMRNAPVLMNLGDDHITTIVVNNESKLKLKFTIVDELPSQFQIRNFHMEFILAAGETKKTKYILRPVVRGEYTFFDLLAFISTGILFVQRKITFELQLTVPVYPSIEQMKNMELQVFSKIVSYAGIKRLRRLGHSYEFEQIRNYVSGDEYRSINWKATSRRSSLMVNQFTDEKSQQVYCVIDKSRNMQMPFNGMTLLDHSINTALIISNIALRKHDKAGLITISDKLDNIVIADRSTLQLQMILDALYRQQEGDGECNYELLYITIRNAVRGRSLLFLFTNFESTNILDRVIPLLRKLNSLHLLVVIFFENVEVREFVKSPADSVKDIYFQAVAEKTLSEKNQIAYQLRRFGVQVIYTSPAELAYNTVNKYLELKSRGMI